jgi:outer membrane lipoprotein-sorting protein
MTNRVFCLAAFFIAMGFFTPCVAAGEVSSPLLALMRKKYDPAQSISTDYSLSIYWSVREREEKRRGSIKLDSGDRFYITTGDESFVSNGTTYWHHVAKARQVVVKNLADVDLSTLPSQLFARFIVSCPFKKQGSRKGLAELVYESDSAGVPYRSIRVWVGENDGLIAKCKMTDRNGNTFTYTFSATRLGKKLPGRSFEFAIPKNAQIVNLRE